MQQQSEPSDTQEISPVIRVRDLNKNYIMGRTVVPALRNVNIAIARGEFAAVMGPSGSGKSTLLHILGCLDRPDSGLYLFEGMPVSRMNARLLADIRNRKIGFVFQSFNLLPWMSALENVELPLVYAGVPIDERRQRAIEALSMIGLSSRAGHRPTELSGGQQQRVAIARVLVTNPSLILADEPTGNLDSHASAEIMSVLQQLNERGSTIVVVTHDSAVASYCRRKILFRDGQVIDDILNEPARANAVQTDNEVSLPQEKEMAL